MSMQLREYQQHAVDKAVDFLTDNKANDMHENAIEWVSKHMVGHNITLQGM